MQDLQTLNSAIAEYLSELTFTGHAKTTLINYETVLSDFSAFLAQEENRQEKISSAACRAWRDSMIERGLKPSTVAQYLTTIKIFFAWCADDELGEEKIFDRNPVTKKMVPKTKKEAYGSTLEPDAIKQLLNSEPPFKAAHCFKKYWPRNYAIVTILLGSKIRNSELLALTPNDLDFEYGELTVRCGKGSKARWAAFDGLAQQAVKLYLKSGIRPSDASEDAPLFGIVDEETGEWRQASRQWLSYLVERHVKIVTGQDGVRTHALRHAGTQIALNNGATMEQLQEELGHSSVVTTQIYSERLKKRHIRNQYVEVSAAREAEALRLSQR